MLGMRNAQNVVMTAIINWDDVHCSQQTSLIMGGAGGQPSATPHSSWPHPQSLLPTPIEGGAKLLQPFTSTKHHPRSALIPQLRVGLAGQPPVAPHPS